MKRLLLSAAVLLTASSAQAASIQLTLDQVFYSAGQTVTLTVFATADAGETDLDIYGQVFYDPAVLGGGSVTQTALESEGGLIPWTNGAITCGAGTCELFSQIQFAIPAPIPVTNTPLILSVATFTYLGGTTSIEWNTTGGNAFDFFDVTNPVGTGIFAIPEPGTAGLVALGLLGLATVRRRRA